MSKKVKRYLMLLTAIGVLAVVVGGGSGTFAGFNAEVANTGNYFATGTMFLHATKQGGTACKSEVDSGNTNILSTNGCQTLFNLSNVSAGHTATVNLELDNAGSIDASKIEFALGSTGCANGKSTITTTTGTVSSGALTTINVSALPYPLISGTSVTITDGTNSDTLTLAANAASGATSIDVTGSSATNTYTSGAKIQYTATFGTSNLCSNLPIYIQEMGSSWSGNQQCVFGGGAGTTCAFTSTHVSDITTYPSLTDLTSSLWSGSSNTNALDAGNSRWFQIAIQTPATLTNANQNQSATFDLVWHIEQ